jgi:hypothetical protein
LNGLHDFFLLLRVIGYLPRHYPWWIEAPMGTKEATSQLQCFVVACYTLAA